MSCPQRCHPRHCHPRGALPAPGGLSLPKVTGDGGSPAPPGWPGLGVKAAATPLSPQPLPTRGATTQAAPRARRGWRALCHPRVPPACPRLSPAAPLTLAPGLRSPELRRGGDRRCPGPSGVPGGGGTKWVTHPRREPRSVARPPPGPATPPRRGDPERGMAPGPAPRGGGDPRDSVGTATQRLPAAPPPWRAAGGARAWQGTKPSRGGGTPGLWGCHR